MKFLWLSNQENPGFQHGYFTLEILSCKVIFNNVSSRHNKPRAILIKSPWI